MDFVNSTILGVVQGATEFIPVSSSGHLIIVRDLLGLQVSHGLAFDAVLQLATTLAVLVYFRKDIWGYIKTFLIVIPAKAGIRKERAAQVSQKEKTLLYAIILGTIPAVILGLFLEEFMEALFRNPTLVAGSLIVGGILMWAAERFAAMSSLRKQGSGLTSKRGFGIGFFQALALIPGFSRSGMTIAGGLFFGLNREAATRFAFLLAFPVLFGSGLKKLFDLSSSGLLSFDTVGGPLLLGSVVSFIVGLAAIHFLITFLKKHTLNTFVVYRFILAILVLVFI